MSQGITSALAQIKDFKANFSAIRKEFNSNNGGKGGFMHALKMSPNERAYTNETNQISKLLEKSI